MQYKTLGNTGLVVSTICLGTMMFSDGTDFWKHIGTFDQAGADAMIKTAIEAGVNFIDTADAYAFGQAETTLGQSLKNLSIPRKDVVICSKSFLRIGPGPNDMGASRAHIIDIVDASLKRLQTDYIDVYQIHGFDPLTPIEETLRALDFLINQGKIRYIGLSNWHAWQIMKALGISELKNLAKFAVVQAYYSLADRELEREIVPLLEDQKLGLQIYSPLAGGLLSGKFSRENDKPEHSRRSVTDYPLGDKERAWRVLDVVNPIAQSRGVSAAIVSLAWLLAKPFVTSVTLGAKRIEQLRENLTAATFTLSPEEVKQLDEASALREEYPGWVVSLHSRMRREGVLHS